jgi:hypothetical protein
MAKTSGMRRITHLEVDRLRGADGDVRERLPTSNGMSNLSRFFLTYAFAIPSVPAIAARASHGDR